MKVSHFPESKTTYFLEVEDYEELRGQSFSIVGHKHGAHLAKSKANTKLEYNGLFWSSLKITNK